MHFFCTPKSVSTQRRVRSVSTLFFLLFPPFPFLFLRKYSKATCKRPQLCVLYNRLCQHLPKPAFAQAKQQIQKEEEDFFFQSRKEGTSQRLSLHKHAQCFRTPRRALTSVSESSEFFQPSTAEMKRSLKERHLLQHDFMRGFTC